MLSELKHNFSIIGLTETKFNTSKEQICNTCILVYVFVSQSSLSNAGGTGFFISEKLSFNTRCDLSEAIADFESLWIKIHSNLQHNLVGVVIYRHPHSSLDSFLNYLTRCLEKINRENKYCVLKGDFNINLLNVDSHLATDEFLDTLTQYYYNSHILQPTRIAHHSATLIDNIFFNSTEHHTISGNVIYELTDYLSNFIIINKFNYLPKNS